MRPTPPDVLSLALAAERPLQAPGTHGFASTSSVPIGCVPRRGSSAPKASGSAQTAERFRFANSVPAVSLVSAPSDASSAAWRSARAPSSNVVPDRDLQGAITATPARRSSGPLRLARSTQCVRRSRLRPDSAEPGGPDVARSSPRSPRGIEIQSERHTRRLVADPASPRAILTRKYVRRPF